jgi:hypothetical protein
MRANIDCTIDTKQNPPSPTSGGFISPLERLRQRREPPNKKTDKTADLKWFIKEDFDGKQTYTEGRSTGVIRAYNGNSESDSRFSID